MNIQSEFRDPDRAFRILSQGVIPAAERIAGHLGRRAVIMEVCGTHTVAISRTGIRAVLGDWVELRSGPGCPVCVTTPGEVDAMINLAREGVTVATFADMLRVPGSDSSLELERARGNRVVVVSSPLQALALAERGTEVAFVAAGFETTAPTVAACVLDAMSGDIAGFSVYSSLRLIPPALNAILESGEIRIDGLLLPGHVAAIIGRQAFCSLAGCGIPAVIAGFEPVDILTALQCLLDRMLSGQSGVENGYGRVVTENGNAVAMRTVDQVFRPVSAGWRGLGDIAGSTLSFRSEFTRFDAARRFAIETVWISPGACRCGDVLSGRIDPPSCALFGRGCVPDHPRGPCMVSSEGACAAWYRYPAVT